MAAPAGIKDVAALAGVSVGTVSNVLNRPHVVRDTTRLRVETAMADLGFVRNESARQLRAGQSRVVAYVFIDAGNPYFTDVDRGAEDGCRDAGLALVMCSSDGDPTREDDYLSLLLEQRVRGVLVTTVDEDGERLRALPRLGIPIVLIDRGDPDGDWCSVGVDDVHGGALAAGHLVEQGHDRIAFVGGPPTIRQMADRLAGARRAMAEAGLPDDRLVVLETEATTVAAGREAGQRLAGLPVGLRPTGVFCGNDLVALGMLQELLRQGTRVPDDVALVGYDDIDFAAAAAVPLTSVRQPRQLLGRTAVGLLLRESDGAAEHPHGHPDGHPAAHGHRHEQVHVHEHVTFTPELVVRESTRRRPSDGS